MKRVRRTISGIGLGALAGLAASLAPATTFETVLVIPDVNWQADAPCDAALRLDLESLPGGSVRDRALEEGDAIRVFRPAAGGVIRIELPEIIPYDVFGEDYAAVYTDMVDRQPLAAQPVDLQSGNSFTVARIETQIASSTQMEIRSRLGRPTQVTLLKDAFDIRLMPRISLARWVGYDAATPEQQSLWDRAQCESIHHELGHLFITAQLFEEGMDAALSLTSDSSETLSAAIEDWFQSVIARVDVRQNRYHDEIRKMGVAAANARPYRELDFPWLDADETLTD